MLQDNSTHAEVEDESISGKIRFISMLIANGYYEGLRLYDAEGNYISETIWSSTPLASKWTDPQEVPVGYQIIGVKVNTFIETEITGLAFVLGPTH